MDSLLFEAGLFANEFREDVVGNRLDFALRQARRMRIACRVVAKILPLEPVAVGVLIGIFVEMGHFGPRPPAGDHLYQLIAIEMGFMQICGSTGRARVAATVTVDAMAELTVPLVLEQTPAQSSFFPHTPINP